jgi:hypothetical protein
MLLTNGRIYLLDGPDDGIGSIVDTLVVREGRVLFAGRRADVNVPAREPTLDLGGRAVLPGLVDAHAHLMHLARLRLSLAVGGRRSETEIAALVGAAARSTPPDAWIEGRGWDQNLWPEPRFPSRHSLDAVAPRHPVVLVRIDGHAMWVNSAALRAAGITRHTRDPAGGRVVRDPAGEPTGLLVDTAQELVRAVVPRPGEVQFDQAVRAAIAECLALGLTGIHEMGVDLPAVAAYRRLIERGQFPFRNYAAIRVAAPEAWAHYRDRGPETVGEGQLVIRAVKLVADGALGSRGAALHAPYCDDPADPDNRGLILLPPEELRRLTREAADRGFQVCVHAIGDRANTLTLDAFEAVFGPAAPRRPDHRPRAEHAQILAERDVPRFARLGVWPSVQPTHCTSDMPWAGARLGADRLRGAYAWRTLRATGVRLAGGSDFPVEHPSPFHGLYAAVTRRPRDGPDPGWQPGERLTRVEAVRAFTTWNAQASHQDGELGSLRPGARADLVVLSEDVFACPAEAIPAIRPVLTMVGGEVVHRADPPPAEGA